ncbi:MAG: hypothetical protein F6J90_10035 [Moorea sp. SIOASIH]|uniref:hypothetical protein n=1 Tax=Moorena sp. SIOASIH TaxID=2607817 RepID=UPI0013B7B32F|nr:hypothetical protein [Moorena sp. SIOASIH]NEO36643.1 hypothetical protein [Moorena sp. SIOASIH]
MQRLHQGVSHTPPSCLLPLASCLLPTPYSLLPTPYSLLHPIPHPLNFPNHLRIWWC